MDVLNMLKVFELIEEQFKNNFTAKKLQERNLTRMYKPLAEWQTKKTTDNHYALEWEWSESNIKLIDFKDTFINFPELLVSINQVKSLLDIKTTEIINNT